MSAYKIAGLASVLFLAACDPQVDTKMISQTPASTAQFAVAQEAAAICGKHSPNEAATLAALNAAGFVESQDDRYKWISNSQPGFILDRPNSDVAVLVGSRGTREFVCIVGLKNMTPEQSFQLALPWVKQYKSVTNASLGQGLANNAVEAWRTIGPAQNVYIAAYKEWDVLDVPGSAARLIIYVK